MESLLESLRKVAVATLTDVDKTIRVMDSGIRRYAGAANMVGIARVVSCENDFLNVLRSLSESYSGEILVVDTENSNRAVLGGLFCTEAKRIGLAGIVVDGPIRDTEYIEQLNLPVYARHSCPCAGTTKQLSSTTEPVLVGGVPVFSNDILVGNKDGVIVANAEHFENIIKIAEDIERKEYELIKRMNGGLALSSMLNLGEHLEAVRRGEISSLEFRIED